MKKTSNIGERIKALRQFKGMSQADLAKRLASQGDLAKRLKISRSAVSAWEIGAMPTPPEALLRLGNLVQYPDNVWLWKLAGLDDQVMLSAAESMLKERGKAPPGSKLIRVPMFSRGSRGKASKGSHILLPGSLVPNPGSTFYIDLDRSSVGEAFAEGDIVVVDTLESQRDPRCPAPFWERLVVVEMSAPNDADPKKLLYWRERMVVGRLQLKLVTGFPEGVAWVAELHLSQDMEGRGPVVVGRWAEMLSPEEVRQLALPENEELEGRTLQESAERAFEKLRFYEGCEIVGEVIFIIPAKAKRRFHPAFELAPREKK